MSEQMDLLLLEAEEQVDRIEGDRGALNPWGPEGRPAPGPPLVSFPLKIDWLNTLPPQRREPHPEPAVAARLATKEETGQGARNLAKQAETNGWAVQVTYARGTTVDARGNPGGLVDSIAVRMQLDPFGAVVSYERGADGKWAGRSAFVWATGSMPQAVSVTDVKEYVLAQGKVHESYTDEEGVVQPSWHDAIRIREAKKKAAAKVTAATRPRTAKEHS